MGLQEISGRKIKEHYRRPALWLTVFFVISVIACKPVRHKLPYLGKHKVFTRTEHGKEITDTVFHKVPDFSLINQDGDSVTQEITRGKICVANFFFASCPSVCPLMTAQLKRVQKILHGTTDLIILSHTVDPERDTPDKLKEYIKKFEINTSNWQFLTGPKEAIYDLGMNGYYLSMGKSQDTPGGFFHSPKFTLVDRQRHIRGWYDGTNASEVDQMIEDIKQLLKQ